jgi:hypothetical protein
MGNNLENKTSTKIELGGYEDFLKDLKIRIRSSQIKAALSVNRELIELYWEIGKKHCRKTRNFGLGEVSC